jgi:hypothetical protein
VLVATRPISFLEYFRVPYTVVAKTSEALVSVARSHACGPRLFWPEWKVVTDANPATARWELDSVPFFARTLSDASASGLLAAQGAGWRPVRPLGNRRGEKAAIWENAHGDIFLPFDPDEAIVNFWSERYRSIGTTRALGGLRRVAMHAYYAARPWLPRSAQIALRRGLARAQGRTRFPRWPTEPALHDLYRLLFELFGRIAGRPLPWIDLWPHGFKWAIVLTHDVETEAGCRSVEPLRRIEQRHGYRSSWNFVPRRYETPVELVQDLWHDGFEVGVHGLYHDGRDLQPATFATRLPAIRAQAQRWGATGFRSPATHRAWELMPQLGFDYDTSSPDTDPFEPQGGGCCTWLPFFNRDLVELPITLVQDHTLFVLLRQVAEDVWVEKAEYLRQRGGMALVITHPDYMLGDDELAAYDRFLARFATDPEAWRALPKEVAEWWRRRAASRLEPEPNGWRVVGPAREEGRVRTAPPP